MTQEAYNVKQVAEKLGVRIEAIRRYIKNGQLKAVKVGNKYIVSEDNYNDFINGKWQHEYMAKN